MKSAMLRILALGTAIAASSISARCQSDAPEPAAKTTPAATPEEHEAARPQAPASKTEAPAAAPVAGPVLSSGQSDYVLTDGDTIQVSIFREPDLTTETSIAKDGTVQLPLIKEVKLAGLTIREARNLLQKLYAENYLRNPQLYLKVLRFAQRHFTIIGQVQKPGSYPLEGGETISLLEAIGMAGGFTRIADHSHLIITRKGLNSPLKANAKRISEGREEPIVIEPGDVITVKESWY